LITAFLSSIKAPNVDFSASRLWGGSFSMPGAFLVFSAISFSISEIKEGGKFKTCGNVARISIMCLNGAG